MRSTTVDHNVSKLQQVMYSKLHLFSRKHNILGRASAIPVAAADVTLETLKTPLRVIECVAMTAINLLGVAFGSPGCSIKFAMYQAQQALSYIASTPVACAMIPFQLFYQLLVTVADPKYAKSIDYYPPYYTLEEPYGIKTSSN